MTGARIKKRFEQHDGDIPRCPINPNPNSNPNLNPNHWRGSWNQSPRSGRNLSGD